MVSCKEYIEKQKSLLKEQVLSFDRRPKLCVIQIGDDTASNSYIRGKKRDCKEIGIECEHLHISDYENFSEADLVKLIEEKNNDNAADGIIVQLPIPKKYDVKVIQKVIAKEKDVDGFKRDSDFTPCTPKGIIDYLKYNEISLLGKVCTVIGRSEIVGKPLVNLLINEGATVISCNSKTPDVKKFTKESDIVISAIGRANYFDETYFHERQVLVDVGINRNEKGKLCGDIKESAKEKVAVATPVPGGVGLLTRMELMENVVEAYIKTCEHEK